MTLPIRQGATHKIVLGPAVAVGDGFTPITNLAVSSADDAEVILHDNGTVVDISGYTFAAIATADGYYHLTLQSGISSTVGHMTVVINDDSLILPIKADFVVMDTEIYDSLYKDAAVSLATAAALLTVDTEVGIIDGIVDAIKLETDKLTLGDAGAGQTGSIIEEIENRPTTAMRGTNNVVLSGPTKSEMDTAHGLLATPAQVNTEVDGALNTAIPGSPTGGSINEGVKRLARSVGVVQEFTITNAVFTATTTIARVDAVDIDGLEATDDHYNGRIMIFTSGVNKHQATDITDYDGTTKQFTYTAVTDIPGDNDTFIVV